MEGTIQYGLELGNKFGIMASTDQHSGYPGSYGDGRIGVMAPSLTRDAIWEALRTRHVCAATGDKNIIDFRSTTLSWVTWFAVTAAVSI